MIYRSLGVLFSETGFSLAFAEFHENAGIWTFDLKKSASYKTGDVSELVSDFFKTNELQYQVSMITVHSDVEDVILNGAPVAALTGLAVISDLPSIDLELGGNGEFYPYIMEKLNIQKEPAGEINKAICVAFMGILRWREEYNFLSSVTGASRSSIGGSVWLGQEA